MKFKEFKDFINESTGGHSNFFKSLFSDSYNADKEANTKIADILEELWESNPESIEYVYNKHDNIKALRYKFEDQSVVLTHVIQKVEKGVDLAHFRISDGKVEKAVIMAFPNLEKVFNTIHKDLPHK